MGTSERERTTLERITRDGHGRNAAYRPWHTVGRTSSRGRSHRIKGRASGRVQHFLSDGEADVCRLLDWCDDVVDVREQFVLVPLDETLEIATSARLWYPTFPGTAEPFPMTTDFVVTRVRPGPGDAYGSPDEVLEAIAFKPAQDLGNPRTLDKLEIERRYWMARGVAWSLVTDVELRGSVVENVRYLAPLRTLADFALPKEDREWVLRRLGASVAADLEAMASGLAGTPLRTICGRVDDQLGYEPGTSLTLARHAMASKRWRVDLTIRIAPGLPLTALVVEQNVEAPAIA